MDGSGIILIGGCMRSGTTLLHRMICASADAPPYTDECHLLTALLQFHADWLMKPDWLKDFCGTTDRYGRFAKSTVDEFLRCALETQRTSNYLVLKNPELTRHFPRLADWYPKAKLFVMVRDPRDTITSILDVADRLRQSGVDSDLVKMGRDMAALAMFYKSYYLDALQSPSCRDRIAVIKYEDLVANPDRAYATLTALTGLRLDPNRISPDRFDRRNRDAHVSAFWTKLLEAPPSTDSVGRYRNALTPVEIAAIERHCADFNRGIRYW